MPNFFYRAKKENAETVSGEVTALNAEEAVDILVKRGLLPVLVEERAAQGGLVTDARKSSVRLRDLYFFTRQLTGLLRSGVALLQAIEVLLRQTRDPAFSRILGEIVVGVRNGRTFSGCLADYPGVFSPLYVAMARAGEESGRLRELLANLVVYFRKQDELLGKVRSALVYPLFMLVVGVGTVSFILTFVMPRIAVLFNGMHVRLPWATLFIMGLSNSIIRGWPILVGVVIVGVTGWKIFGQAAALRRASSAFLFSLPVVNNMVLKVDMERFARTLGLLLGSGIPILKALQVAVPTLSSDKLKRVLSGVQERVAGGAGFGESLREADVFPEMFAQLITIGEESGELSAALNDIADTYEQEIAEVTKTLTTLLEPLMILIVGAVVGFIVFAMLMPIFQMDIFSR